MKTQISGMTDEQKLNFFIGNKIQTTYVEGPSGKGHLPICRDVVIWHKPCATAAEAISRGVSYMVALKKLAEKSKPVKKELRSA